MIDSRELRMNLMRMVADDCRDEVVPLFLYFVRDFAKCDAMLAWLIHNNITGKNLSSWLTIVHKKSNLKAATDILTCIEKNIDKRIILGRDIT